eukprot:gene10675-biopygen7240
MRSLLRGRHHFREGRARGNTLNAAVKRRSAARTSSSAQQQLRRCADGPGGPAARPRRPPGARFPRGKAPVSPRAPRARCRPALPLPTKDGPESGAQVVILLEIKVKRAPSAAARFFAKPPLQRWPEFSWPLAQVHKFKWPIPGRHPGARPVVVAAPVDLPAVRQVHPPRGGVVRPSAEVDAEAGVDDVRRLPAARGGEGEEGGVRPGAHRAAVRPVGEEAVRQAPRAVQAPVARGVAPPRAPAVDAAQHVVLRAGLPHPPREGARHAVEGDGVAPALRPVGEERVGRVVGEGDRDPRRVQRRGAAPRPRSGALPTPNARTRARTNI